MLRLYDYGESGNAYKVRLLLALLGERFERVHLDILKGETRRPEKMERVYHALGVMESHLSGHAFFVADAYSIADIALYAYTHVAYEGGFDLDRFPSVAAWLERVASRPGHILITDEVGERVPWP